jgi:hypothetical protein
MMQPPELEDLDPTFPLSSAGKRLRSNWNAPARTDLLPHSWKFSVFIVNILIMQIT